MDGTITKLERVNPHVQVYFDQKDAVSGKIQAWRIEMESPAALQEQWIARDTFKPGLDIKRAGMLVKPGTHALRPLEVTTADGLRWAARVNYR